jgi:hypothetical protein
MSRNTGNLGSLINSFFASLLKRFGSSQPPVTPPVPQSPSPPDNNIEPARILTSRVLLVIYDPVMNTVTGKKLSSTMNWQRVDDLVTGFIADIATASGGLARYQVVDRIELNEFPSKTDGYRYTPETFMAVMQGATPYAPSMANYNQILTQLNILQRVQNREIDEVWLFAFPHAGFYESRMAGMGAFWCNSPALDNTSSCNRKFIIMGFSYERRVGEMLESFGHRSESILIKTFEKALPGMNLYERFSRYDKKNPGLAEVGNIHFAPNSDSDYDWNNPRLVPSHCDDWLHFPGLPGPARQVNADEWGNGDIRLHHNWWLRHLPKVAGRTASIANNWWQYIIDPNLIGL